MQGSLVFYGKGKGRTGYEKRLFASLQEPQILYISIRLLPDRIVPNYYHLLFLRAYSF